MNLRIPGPTPLPPEVRDAMAKDMIDHRSTEFETMLRETTDLLRRFYQTQGDVMLLTASGTGGLEAALVNVLSPGDQVLAVSSGHFGERFAATAKAYGADVIMLEFPWGQALDPNRVADVLKRLPRCKALMTTHNETSTGVLNDLNPVAEVLSSLGSRRPLWLVDAVSSLGAAHLPMDAWGCDLVVTASQKAWMAPPGLAFVGVSQRAWDAMPEARCPRFYFDLAAARTFAAKGQTPFTPAVSVLYALHVSLRLMAAEGLEAIVARHRRLAAQTRAGLQSLGFRLFAEESHASPTVTASYVPEGITGSELKERVAGWGVQIATGQGPFKDKLVRVAHLGYCSEQDIVETLAAIRGAVNNERGV
jgi:aspartate aminotransferase-like enzyme